MFLSCRPANVYMDPLHCRILLPKKSGSGSGYNDLKTPNHFKKTGKSIQSVLLWTQNMGRHTSSYSWRNFGGGPTHHKPYTMV